ncbi:MAG TPA: aspartate aminotransferase family protein, partial [Thermohalobaculum sp.]|nr:aspartate aminotransferase family protein [Thermohalobaculum sp.]
MIPAVMPTYARAPLEIERGEGAWLVTRDGTRYLDFGAGIAVNVLGHAHPRLVEALTAQAGRLWHTSNMYPIAEQERLAARLVEATFADTVFFTNSGVEAIECALKTARKHQFEKGTGRTRIITFEGSFHGRSLAAISAAGSDKMTRGFGPLLPGFDVLPFGDHDALQAAVTDETAAILVEPVQGEGGVRPLPQACMRGLRQLCDQHGMLLILDEIQSGVGRTGRLFAHEHAGIRPDIMAIAKGIGGGFPLGACLATGEAASGMGVGAHGSTYGGNPLACAVGNAVLDEVLAEGFLDEVNRKAGHLRQRLAELGDSHPGLVAEVRGAGLMIGVKLTDRTEPRAVLGAARDERLLLVA